MLYSLVVWPAAQGDNLRLDFEPNSRIGSTQFTSTIQQPRVPCARLKFVAKFRFKNTDTPCAYIAVISIHHCSPLLHPAHSALWPRPQPFQKGPSPSSAPGLRVAQQTMRALCAAAAKELGQAIAVENKVGASGMIGLKAMTSAKPDGYTIGQIPISVTRFSQLGA